MNQASPRTYCQRFSWILFLLLYLLPSPGIGQTTADSSMAIVRSLYDDGKYSNAEFEARRLLERKEIGDSLRIQIEQQLAFALVAQGQHDAAVEHFSAIFLLSPSFELDAVLTSPKIMIAFNEAKLQSFSRQRHPGTGTVPTTTYGHASWRTLVFPGWEQSYRGRSSTGIVFAGAGAATLASLIYCDIQRRETRNDYLSASMSLLAASKYTRYNRYYKAEIYSVLAFAAVYFASQLDVILTPPEQLSFEAQPHGIALCIRW